ncbi:MAG: GAF domain-containing sensor histidine kinase [Cyanobacteria bacterium J06559_1]
MSDSQHVDTASYANQQQAGQQQISQRQADQLPPDQAWDHLAKTTLEHLTSLSFRQDNLNAYLNDIARGVSQLISIDWSIVTLNLGERSQIIASSTELDDSDYQPYSLHGSVAQTVVKTGCSLAVTDTDVETHHGANPPGYRAYLGIPLQSSTGKLLGTICSFHQQPRQFPSEEIKCVELFAERATTAIDNFQLYQQQLKFNEVLEEEVAKRTAELKAAQAQLIEKERLAAIGEFTSMIVHEIRNPLTTVRMGLLALQALELSKRDRMRLTLAMEEEHRLKELLNEILQYAKPQVLETTTFDLHQLVTETVSTLSEQPLVEERHLNVVSELSDVLVEGDRNKLKQVLINLISNACEAISPGESVNITLSPQPNPLEQPQIRLDIHNGGDPIEPNILAQLTKPFFSTKSSGNGLGLAIVKRIVEAHNGSLIFTSTAAVGTTASVYLPKN